MGVHSEYLRRLCRQGRLERVGRGMYSLPGFEMELHHSLAEAAKRVPRCVVCLLSALTFHNLTTQMPSQVWIAIDRKARKPKTDGVKLRIMRFSGAALSQGIEEHSIEGIPVRVFSVAKTIADCFKYRNKVGLDVALEVLREGWRERRFTMDDLWRYAKICRVANVMSPYLESLP
jgi:predicted transcriptional regulator of viral defense system